MSEHCQLCPGTTADFMTCPGRVCRECVGKEAEIAQLRLDVKALSTAKEVGGSWMATAHEEREKLLALKDATRKVVEALDRCESHRGRFSCTPLHDCRCECERGISRACTCGSEELMNALADPVLVALRRE
jgi:hypothetical protein